MRITYLFGAALAAWSLAGAAAAQGATGFPMGDVGQVLRQHEQPLTTWAPPPGPLSRLSKASRTWIAEETKRQIATPRAPTDVYLAIETALARDVLRQAKRERIDPADYYSAVLFQIMLAAEADAERAVKAGAEPERLIQARANREQAGEMQSQNSLYMAAM